MKKVFLTLVLSTLVFFVQAQMPKTFGYQAAIRNADGMLLKNQSVGIRITIFSVPADTVYYQETHTTTTDTFGVATINIMGGTSVINELDTNGGFAGIVATSHKPMMKVEIDPAGGNAYSLTSETQLLPVPYAVYAEDADRVASRVGDMPLVEVTVKVTGDGYQESGQVKFLGETINIGEEKTFKIPAYSPVYISSISAGVGGTHSYRREVSLNGKNISLPYKSQYISTSDYNSIKRPVRLATEDKTVYMGVYSSGTAQTIANEQMKPLYGTTKSQSNTQFNTAYENRESVLYVECPTFELFNNQYTYEEELKNI